MPPKKQPVKEVAADEADPDFAVDPDQMRQLLASGNPALIEAMQRGLARMVGQSSGYIESLPAPVRARISYLEDLQQEYDTLEEEFDEEMKALEAKYKALYKPLFDKRRSVIMGEADAPDNETPEGKKAVKEAGEEGASGIPEFWLIAMRNHPEIDDQITDKDAEVLAFLVDVRSEDVYDDEDEDEGFKLIFTFAENPFFTDKELSVTYRVVEEGGYVSVKDIEGSDIHWHADKDVTVKKMKKKPKAGSKTKPQIKVEAVDSFFRLFTPPPIPDDDEDDEQDEEAMEAIQEEVERHMAIGELFREEIIPNAVEWFTGAAAAAAEMGEDSEEDEEYSDEEGDDDDDEDDESEEDDDDEGGEGGKVPKDKQDPADCKQQ